MAKQLVCLGIRLLFLASELLFLASAGGHRPCKMWYTLINNGTVLASVNRNSGKTTIQGPLSSSTGGGSSAAPLVTAGSTACLAFNPVDKRTYAIVRGASLVQLKVGALTLINQRDTGVEQIGGMAITQRGVIYLYSNKDTGLYRFHERKAGDGASSSSSLVFVTGIPNIIDLTYSFQTDSLYATDGRALYSIVPHDANQTRVLGSIPILGSSSNDTAIAGISVTPRGELYAIANKAPNAAVYKFPRVRQGDIATIELRSSSTLPTQALGGAIVCKKALPPSAFPPTAAPRETKAPSDTSSNSKAPSSRAPGISSRAPSSSTGSPSAAPSSAARIRSAAPSAAPSVAPSDGGGSGNGGSPSGQIQVSYQTWYQQQVCLTSTRSSDCDTGDAYPLWETEYVTMEEDDGATTIFNITEKLYSPQHVRGVLVVAEALLQLQQQGQGDDDSSVCLTYDLQTRDLSGRLVSETKDVTECFPVNSNQFSYVVSKQEQSDFSAGVTTSYDFWNRLRISAERI